MTDRNMPSLIEDAFASNEVRGILLGVPPYNIVPKFSSAPFSTDLTVPLSYIYNHRAELDPRAALEESLLEIARVYDGILPAALTLLYECLQHQKGTSLGLDVELIAATLRRTIEIHAHRLTMDVSPAARGYPNRLMGEVQRLDCQLQKHGGPSIFDKTER